MTGLRPSEQITPAEWYASQGLPLTHEGQKQVLLSSASGIEVYDKGRDPRMCSADGNTCKAYKSKATEFCAGHLRALGVLADDS